MIYTNKHNLAPEIVAAIIARQAKYDPGDVDFSVTQIIDSPRVVRLTKDNYDKLEVDVHDLLEPWQGHLLHDALEKDETSGRAEIQVQGRKVSGAWDFFQDGILKDYKRTSIWTYIYGSMNKKYEQQLNVYAYILRQHGHNVSKCGIEFLFKDWSEQKARYDSTYPQKRQMFVEFPVWHEDYQREYIDDQIQKHIAAEKELPLCTPDEMWEKPTTYAVMKEGRKSAVRLFDTKTECESHIEEKNLDKKHYIEVRKGERTRCERYCDVSSICTQYQEYRNGT